MKQNTTFKKLSHKNTIKRGKLNIVGGELLFSSIMRFGSVLFGSVRIPKLQYSYRTESNNTKPNRIIEENKDSPPTMLKFPPFYCNFM